MPSRPKSEDYLENLLKLRVLVGFLGQKNLKNWWDTALMETTGIRFLETLFPRTSHLAALNSTVEAACHTHDEAIGRIGLFHLFRLPIALEDRISAAAEDVDISKVLGGCEDVDSAMDQLKGFVVSGVSASDGPVQIGVESHILRKASIEELAAHYHSAFEKEICCFPYFGPSKSNG
ncbi:BrxE family protein [Verrucomicrobiales bacterium]|nr:BrxE family protein [Verrucomicrobiales bacterium]